MNLYLNKTVLVTGATGLMGSHIVHELMKMKNVRVIALSRSAGKLEECFKEYLGDSNFIYVAQNIIEPLKCEWKLDYIFHAAGPMEGKYIQNYPIDVINPNIMGTINCLEFLRKQKIEKQIEGRLILFSSVTVYGNNTQEDIVVTECETGVTETLESAGAPYSQAKRMAEVITRAYIKQYDVNAVIGRFSTVYGYTHFLPDTAFYEFIKKGINGENIVIHRADLPRRDNIYVDDAVRGILLIGSEGVCGEAYNISSNGELDNYASVDEIAQIIVRVSNKKIQDRTIQVMSKNESNGNRIPGLKMNNSKLTELGWSINVSLNEGIEKTIEACMNRKL